MTFYACGTPPSLVQMHSLLLVQVAGSVLNHRLFVMSVAHLTWRHLHACVSPHVHRAWFQPGLYRASLLGPGVSFIKLFASRIELDEMRRHRPHVFI